MTQFTIDNYITISGRLRRKDYWLLTLPPWIIGVITAVLRAFSLVGDSKGIPKGFRM